MSDHRRANAGGGLPRGLAALAAVAVAFVLVPFIALVQRAPWSDLGHLLGRSVVTDALRLSLVASLAATALSVLFGVPLAWLLARTEFRGRAVVRALTILPMVLPPVVGGAALLFAFGRRGLLGGPVYDATGFVLPFSIWGVIAANTFVAMPFLVVAVEAGLRSADRRYDEAAATLGADRWTVLRRVTLPSVAPSLAAGAALCWARALGEFGATITFAGNLQGRTQTMPLAVYLELERDRGAAIALSLVPDRGVARRPGAAPRPLARHRRGTLNVLRADIGMTLGALDLSVSLEIAEGEVVALLGPNGAGKTTTLRAIAGLEPIDQGRIELDGQLLDDPDAGVLVPPHDREIGVVFQDYLLFAHLTVLDNVAFGLRARGTTTRQARAQAEALLQRVGLADRAGTRPGDLSGGQAQRVALARALAIEPRLLLLDEPLAALDAQTRQRVRSDLHHHLAEYPGARLLVTHDPVDAVVLASRLVIIEDGRVTQTGTTAEVTARPRTRYVADLVGINLLVGADAGDGSVRLDSGHHLAVAGPLPGPEVAIAVRPQSIALSRHEVTGSPRNRWEATVAEIHPDRDRVRVTLAGPVPATAEITPSALAELELRPGTAVWASVKAVDLDVYPR